MWSALVRAVGVPIKLLFGFDAFVSYSRQDGTNYTEALSSELARFIRLRIDMQEARSGERITFLLRLSIMFSKVLVVVCTPESAQSIHVQEEIQTFVDFGGGPIVLVEVSTPVEDACWWHLVQGLPRIRRQNEIPASDLPSAKVTQRIVNNVGYWRLSRRQSFLSLLFGIILASSSFFSYRANILRRDAAAESMAQTAEAERQRAEALKQGAEAVRQRAEARKQGAIAVLRRREAAEYEAQAQSRALAAEAEQVLPLDQAKAVEFAIKALQVSRTREASNALAHVFPQLLTRIAGHKEYLTAAEFSPDGLKVLTASGDHTAALWNANDGSLLFTFPQDETVNVATFSPDGQRAVTATSDGLARIWRIADGKMIATLSGHIAEIHTAVFSPDGDQVVTASADHTARVWSGSQGKLLFILGDVQEPISDINGVPVHNDVNGASYSSDGRRIVTANKDGMVNVWDVSNGRLLLSIPATSNVDISHPFGVRTASFSPDGRQIVTACEDEKIRVWNASSGRLLTILGDGVETGEQAIFSPDGGHILTIGKDKASLWDGSSKAKQVAKLEIHPGGVAGYSSLGVASFSRDGRRILDVDSADNTVRMWNATNGHLMAILSGHTGQLVSAAFSRDGDRIVTASSDGTARVWGLMGSQLTATLSHPANGSIDSADFSPDARLILTTGMDASARIWNKSTGLLQATIHSQIGGFERAVFSPNGDLLLASGYENEAQIWTTADGRLKTKVLGTYRGSDNVSAMFSPDGKRVVTSDEKGNAIRIWSTANGKVLGTLSNPRGYIEHAVFSPDGRNIVTAGSDARVWDASGFRLRFILSGHFHSVETAEFSPDGQRILTVSKDSVRIWQRVAGRLLASFDCSPFVVKAAAFSSDGKRIITTCTEELRVSDAFNGKKLGTISTGHDVSPGSVSSSRDGHWIVTRAEFSGASVWNSSNGALSAILYPDQEGEPAYSPYGQDIVTVVGRTARIYRLLSLDDIAELLR